MERGIQLKTIPKALLSCEVVHMYVAITIIIMTMFGQYYHIKCLVYLSQINYLNVLQNI